MLKSSRSSSPNSVITRNGGVLRELRGKSVGGRQMALVSPYFFLISILIGGAISFRAGTMFKTQVISFVNWRVTPYVTGNILLTLQEKHLVTARYRQSLVEIADDEKCPQTQELAIEEVSFIEGYGQQRSDESDESDDIAFAYQVIMDFQKLDFQFLSDQGRIRDSIMNTIWHISADFDLAILSLHCQKLVGVTCAAILNGGSHMTVATDPDNLSASLSLFSADNHMHLLDVIPVLESNFGVGEKPRFVFRHILRGVFDYKGTALESDLSEFLLHEKDRNYNKKEIGSIETDFQEVHVWETLHTTLQSVDSYERSREAGVDNYYTQNPELFSPNRVLFLDGVMQSTSRGDEAYHEALVHPAMFAHPDGPKRAAIIGGGEGATLREILKHKSIETCMMIEIDRGMVDAARDWLPQLNDCSDFGSGSCFDEERTDLRCEDAFGWFLNRFNAKVDVPLELKTDPFDIIVIDALDPEDNVAFAVHLYQDQDFWSTMKEALTDNGILVVQLGMTPRSAAFGEEFGINKNRANLFKTIEAVGFQHVFIYHDTHSDFKFPWSFLAACKSEACVKEWNQNEAQLNLRIQERLLLSKSGKPMLSFFDGATMQDFQRPHKTWENAHCRQIPEPEECKIHRNIAITKSWSDVFERFTENDAISFITKSKISMGIGSVIRHKFNDSDLSHSLLPQAVFDNPFLVFESHFGRNSTCSDVTRTAGDMYRSRKINPLRRRHPELWDFEMETDIRKSETIRC